MAPTKTGAYCLLAAAYVAGCASLGLFGVFLWGKSLALLDLGLSTSSALGMDAGLSLLFFLQHSGMIRKPFRARLVSVLTEHHYWAVYAVVSGIALLLVPLLWQPTKLEIVTLHGTWRWLPRALFLAAIAGMVWAFASLQSFDPLGARPLLAGLRGAPAPPMQLSIRGPYRWVRHPIYALFLPLMWASPDLTADRLLFNLLWTAWMVIATRLEERDLEAAFGDEYRSYQRRVPMLLPHSLHSRIETKPAH